MPTPGAPAASLHSAGDRLAPRYSRKPPYRIAQTPCPTRPTGQHMQQQEQHEEQQEEQQEEQEQQPDEKNVL